MARRCGRPARPHGLIAGGYRAIDSLRLEKGYRVWAADITPDEHALRGRAGLLRAGGPAVPRRGRRWRRGAGPDARDCAAWCSSDPRSVALGNEPVRVGGEVVGRVTTGGYGYTVERSIAYAYLPAEVGLGTEVEIDIFGQWVAGEVTAEPLLDPEGARLRAIS